MSDRKLVIVNDAALAALDIHTLRMFDAIVAAAMDVDYPYDDCDSGPLFPMEMAEPRDIFEDYEFSADKDYDLVYEDSLYEELTEEADASDYHIYSGKRVQLDGYEPKLKGINRKERWNERAVDNDWGQHRATQYRFKDDRYDWE